MQLISNSWDLIQCFGQPIMFIPTFIDNKRAISSQSQENGSSSGRRSVKDVIPESRLAQFYGNFYYDEVRLLLQLRYLFKDRYTSRTEK